MKSIECLKFYVTDVTNDSFYGMCINDIEDYELEFSKDQIQVGDIELLEIGAYFYLYVYSDNEDTTHFIKFVDERFTKEEIDRAKEYGKRLYNFFKDE